MQSPWTFEWISKFIIIMSFIIVHKVCSLYEAAVKAESNNEELHSHLFMSYVRIGDYKAQQRAAMALYKFSAKNPYYFWAVMSIVLQVFIFF